MPIFPEILLIDSPVTWCSIWEVRLLALMLLAVIVPRFSVAVPVGKILCLGDDHSSLDCHDSVVRQACNTQTRSAEQANCCSTSESTCIDVPSTQIESPRPGSGTLILHFDFVVEVLLPADDALCFQHRPDQFNGGDDPPVFCARAYCCAISPRC